ncbi:hypothetical protein GE09DRAFT_226846 [Coniochaeta sp. 2T2.1]|nr:hypothetical protein GE09DRAFT_226846 [Coniochaeta sp. 2T2.1]
MSHLSPHPRPQSSASIASDTTFHSFNHAEPQYKSAMPEPPSRKTHTILASHGMHRQDSGYESMTPASPPPSSRRQSAAPSVTSSSPRSRTKSRPSVRRAAKSGPVIHVPRPNIQKSRSTTFCPRYRQAQAEQSTYHEFPQFTPSEQTELSRATSEENSSASGAVAYTPDTTYTAGTEHYRSSPPQTTQYWTSDRTRRLEYAAIDAASRGVRGWVMRHMVPDCFIPEDRRCVRFDDDSGSVVRYRLDLDEDDRKSARCLSAKKRKSRWFGTS